MPPDLLIHHDEVLERRQGDRRGSERRTPVRAADGRRGRERRSHWASAPTAVKAPRAVPEGRPLPGVRTRERRYRRALAVADAGASAFALVLSFLVAGLSL